MLVVVCAVVVQAAEPASSGYASFGDAVWWAIVTFTTVGYGDLYPVTSGGRVAAVLLMLGGVALIGSLAASLGSFFNSGGGAAIDDEGSPVVEPTVDTNELVLTELRALRAEVAELRDRLS